MMPLVYAPLGDRTLSIQFEPVISVNMNRRIHAFATIIREQNIAGVIQTVITFHTLAVVYDPAVLLYDELEQRLRQLERQMDATGEQYGQLVHIPVAFGGEFGPDLAEIAAAAQMLPQQVVQLLAERSYYVHMIGFIAGLPYCGEIDERLVKPRRSSPRLHVPLGSVAIADRLATVYTIDSPGGWHLMGWSPMLLFDPHRDQPGLLAAGDSVRFVPIEAREAMAWDAERQKEWDERWHISR
jgi:inhibitor of KinA